MPMTSKGQKTRNRILTAAARRFRKQGMASTSVGDVMREAGLTHGGFYLHFESKEQLEAEAFSSATTVNRRSWFQGIGETEASRRLERLVRRYLNRPHRDRPDEGCPFASLAGEVAHSESESLRESYERELNRSAFSLAEELQGSDRGSRGDRALAILALCIGGILMSRAVRSRRLSDRILRACRKYILEAEGALAIPSSARKREEEGRSKP